MITVIFIVLVALITGGVLKFIFDRSQTGYTISWPELAIGGVVCALVIAWPVVHIGTKLAQANAATYKEYWSGYEAVAFTETYNCFKYSDESFSGDSCAHHYDCDPYDVPKTRVVTYTDANGDTQTRIETYTETHWHHCPESKIERSYFVDTTLGEYTIAAHLLPPHPYEYEWDHDGRLPAYLVASARVPAFWTAAKARIASGKPGPVSAIKPYKNYILASQKTILKKYSGSIDGYRKDGLMPDVATLLAPPYLGQKAYLVGAPVGVKGAVWVDAVNRFNAAFGSDLQGDVHLLIVNANKVPLPDEWFGALNANWQSKKQKRNAIAKNTVIVALGTKDGKTIAWVRASTGMPLGNEALLTQIQSDLKGQPLDPVIVIGDPVATITKVGKKWKATVIPGSGILASDAWGTNRFVRVCMTCKDASDNGIGYGYLSGEIQPSTGAKIGIVFVALILCLLVWGAMLAIGPIPIGNSTERNWR